jgi:phosphotransferase family enzyme
MQSNPLPEVARADRLTAALQQSGALGNGSVREVTVESASPTVVSTITRLRLAYDAEPAGAPRSLVLKTGRAGHSGGAWTVGRQEVAFYKQVAPAMPAGIAPRCYEAHWDPDTEAWHLLLEDLTDTHATASPWPLPPAFEQCLRIVGAWARFHAAWWDHPDLGLSIGTRPDAAALESYLQTLAGHVARFSDRLGDALPRERREFFDQLLDAAPRLLADFPTRRHVTVAHGDAHVWNCLVPRDGASGDVRLLDWENWRIGPASADLAYMLAVHWYPDRRHRLERPLLDHYHAVLAENGVRDYSRADLHDQYRASVLWQITTPVWQAAYNLPPVIWWNNLERVLLAVEDLGCRDLLP